VRATGTTSGNFNTLVAGSTVALPAVFVDSYEKNTLSARVSVTAATATLTLSVIWQVSNNGSTWYRAVGSDNGSTTVLSTGTSAAVERVIAAPGMGGGWRYIRAAILTGVATGTASDLYAASYNYLADASFSE